MRILLTGADGQLGRAARVGFAGHELLPRTRQELDVCDLESVRRALHGAAPDLVLNAAAWTDVDGAERQAGCAFAANAVGPRNLALATSECGAALLHVSTDYVFDGDAGRAYHEFDAPVPRSVYGRSKLAGEEAVRTFNPRHYVVRTAWLYSHQGRNFVQTMRALASRPEVRVVDDQRGSPTYAPHLAAALAELVATRAFGTYHLAGRGETSWYGLTVRLYAELGIATPVVPVDTAAFPREAERPRCSALVSLQRPRIGLPDWEQGVADCVAAMARGG